VRLAAPIAGPLRATRSHLASRVGSGFCYRMLDRRLKRTGQ
jgi:hypothetical protein